MGARQSPEGTVEPDRPEYPPPVPGLAVRGRALEAPRPLVRSGGVNRRPRRYPDVKQLELRRAAPYLRPHRRAPSRARGRGGARFESVSVRSASSSRGAPNFQAKNPLFKEREPELHVAYRLRGLSPGSTASVALHDASLASDHPVCVLRRRFAPTPRANRRSSDAPFSNRFPPDRMNGAGVRRFRAPSIHETAPFAWVEFPRPS
jgi:hypothetical protein